MAPASDFDGIGIGKFLFWVDKIRERKYEAIMKKIVPQIASTLVEYLRITRNRS